MTSENGDGRKKRGGGRKPRQVHLEEAIEEQNAQAETQPSETDADEAEQREAEQRTNSALTEDEKVALLYHHKRLYEEAEADLKAAQAARAAVKDKAKAELGKHAVTAIKDLILLDTPEGEKKMRDELERRIRVAGWACSEIGQYQMFGGASVDPTPAVDRAREAGKVAGMKGDVCKPPHDPSVPQYAAWMEGWRIGQDALASAFQKLKTDDPPANDPEPVDTSDRPFGMPDDQQTSEDPAEGMPAAPAMPDGEPAQAGA